MSDGAINGLRIRIATALFRHEHEAIGGDWDRESPDAHNYWLAAADAAISALKVTADNITQAVEEVIWVHDFGDRDRMCSCGVLNNMDGDLLQLHRTSLIGAAIRGVLGVSDA